MTVRAKEETHGNTVENSPQIRELFPTSTSLITHHDPRFHCYRTTGLLLCKWQLSIKQWSEDVPTR